MDFWTVAVEFVKALAWPSVVVLALCFFRRPLAAKLRDLAEAEGPGVKAKFFDRDARKAAAEASAAGAVLAEEAKGHRAETMAAEEQGAGDIPEWLDYALVRLPRAGALGRHFVTAETHPRTAVWSAYQDLIDVASAAYAVQKVALPQEGMGITALLGSLTSQPDADLLSVAEDLQDLHRQSRRSAAEIGTDGARSFVEAAINLSRPIASKTLSQIRHPSRFPLLGMTETARAGVWAATQVLIAMLWDDDDDGD